MYDCFGYELALNQRQYILSSGVWYEVATDFIARVNALAKKLRLPKELLPAWDGKLSEGQYNLMCGERAGFLNFDAEEHSVRWRAIQIRDLRRSPFRQ